MNVAFATARDRWLNAWPDALAFVAGLVVAGIAGWDTRDLVWSLWLSSFVVGYAMIVWTIFSCAWGRVGEMLGGACWRSSRSTSACFTLFTPAFWEIFSR